MKRATGRQQTQSPAPSREPVPARQFNLTTVQKAALLQRARKAIECHLLSKELLPFDDSDPVFNLPAGVFITLRTVPSPAGRSEQIVDHHPHGPLRGCVGRLQADLPLFQVVEEMAVRSATKDPRFQPLRPDELAQTRIEISLLTPLTLVTDAEQIKVGTHGLVMDDPTHKGGTVAVGAGYQRMEPRAVHFVNMSQGGASAR